MMTDQLDSSTVECLERLVRRRLRFLKAEDALAVEDNLGELGLDSMASIELLVDIEDHFGVQIPEDYLAENTFQSLSTLSELLSKALKR